MQEYGRGNRIRKQVNYVDDMTDNQWLKMIEEAKEFTDDPVLNSIIYYKIFL